MARELSEQWSLWSLYSRVAESALRETKLTCFQYIVPYPGRIPRGRVQCEFSAFIFYVFPPPSPLIKNCRAQGAFIKDLSDMDAKGC